VDLAEKRWGRWGGVEACLRPSCGPKERFTEEKGLKRKRNVLVRTAGDQHHHVAEWRVEADSSGKKGGRRRRELGRPTKACQQCQNKGVRGSKSKHLPSQPKVGLVKRTPRFSS